MWKPATVLKGFKTCMRASLFRLWMPGWVTSDQHSWVKCIMLHKILMLLVWEAFNFFSQSANIWHLCVTVSHCSWRNGTHIHVIHAHCDGVMIHWYSLLLVPVRKRVGRKQLKSLVCVCVCVCVCNKFSRIQATSICGAISNAEK